MPKRNTPQNPDVITLCTFPDCTQPVIALSELCEQHTKENDALLERQKEVIKEKEKYLHVADDGETMLTKNNNPVTLLSYVSVKRDYLIVRLPKDVVEVIKINKEKRKEIRENIVAFIQKEGVKGNPGLIKHLGRHEEHLYQLIDSIGKWLGCFDWMTNKPGKKSEVNIEEIEEKARTQANRAMLDKMPEVMLRQWASSLDDSLDNDMPLPVLKERMLAYL